MQSPQLRDHGRRSKQRLISPCQLARFQLSPLPLNRFPVSISPLLGPLPFALSSLALSHLAISQGARSLVALSRLPLYHLRVNGQRATQCSVGSKAARAIDAEATRDIDAEAARVPELASARQVVLTWVDSGDWHARDERQGRRIGAFDLRRNASLEEGIPPPFPLPNGTQ